MSSDSSSPLTQRHWIGLTALISGMVALYLHLWKVGVMGPLSCSNGHGCELVQLSSWGWFLGVDVALIGTIGYTMILLTCIVGLQPSLLNDRRITLILMLLIFPAIAFTIRLKYAEFIILKTFCPWCAISAVTITLHGILVLFDWRRTGRTRLKSQLSQG